MVGRGAAWKAGSYTHTLLIYASVLLLTVSIPLSEQSKLTFLSAECCILLTYMALPYNLESHSTTARPSGLGLQNVLWSH